VSVTVRDLSPQNKNTNRFIKFLHPSASYFLLVFQKNIVLLKVIYFKVSHNEKLPVAILTCTSLAKPVPLHATEALMGRGVVAPTHYRSRH
jgi:hypothetical protein